MTPLSAPAAGLPAHILGSTPPRCRRPLPTHILGSTPVRCRPGLRSGVVAVSDVSKDKILVFLWRRGRRGASEQPLKSPRRVGRNNSNSSRQPPAASESKPLEIMPLPLCLGFAVVTNSPCQAQRRVGSHSNGWEQFWEILRNNFLWFTIVSYAIPTMSCQQLFFRDLDGHPDCSRAALGPSVFNS